MTFNAYSLISLVKTHGQSLTLTYGTSSSYDPATGTNTVTDDTEVFKGYFYNDNNGLFTEFDVVRGTRALLVPYDNLTATPAVGNTVTGQRDTVKITSVGHIMSGDNPVCYVLGTGE